MRSTAETRSSGPTPTCRRCCHPARVAAEEGIYALRSNNRRARTGDSDKPTRLHGGNRLQRIHPEHLRHDRRDNNPPLRGVSYNTTPAGANYAYTNEHGDSILLATAANAETWTGY